jgi:hypothetical protein
MQGTEAWMGVPDDVRYRPIYARLTDGSLIDHMGCIPACRCHGPHRLRRR